MRAARAHPFQVENRESKVEGTSPVPVRVRLPVVAWTPAAELLQQLPRATSMLEHQLISTFYYAVTCVSSELRE